MALIFRGVVTTRVPRNFDLQGIPKSHTPKPPGYKVPSRYSLLGPNGQKSLFLSLFSGSEESPRAAVGGKKRARRVSCLTSWGWHHPGDDNRN